MTRQSSDWQRAPTFIAIPMMLSIFALSSFALGAKADLHGDCQAANPTRSMKPRSIAKIEFVKLPSTANDVVNTYRVWLRHELFQGELTGAGFAGSEKNSLIEFTERRTPTLLLTPARLHHD